jgi:hypothetical protein
MDISTIQITGELFVYLRDHLLFLEAKSFPWIDHIARKTINQNGRKANETLSNDLRV